MEKGYINVDEREINDITSHLGRNQVHLGDLGNNSQKTFKSFANANLFSNGARKITQQISSISQSIGKMNNAIKTQTNEMMQLDNKLSSEAESLKIPMDFVRNNSVRAHIFDGITLKKKDGQSVKDDNSLNQSELKLDSTVINKNLQDITTEEKDFTNVKLKEYRNKTTNLGNINNNQITENEELKFGQNGIIEQQLNSNIAKMNNQLMPDVDTSTKINKTTNLEFLDLDDKEIVNEYYYDDFFEKDDY